MQTIQQAIIHHSTQLCSTNNNVKSTKRAKPFGCVSVSESVELIDDFAVGVDATCKLEKSQHRIWC